MTSLSQLVSETEEMFSQVSKEKKYEAKVKAKQVTGSIQQVDWPQVDSWKTRKQDKPVQSSSEIE
jgi:hypothetical protein